MKYDNYFFRSLLLLYSFLLFLLRQQGRALHILPLFLVPSIPQKPSNSHNYHQDRHSHNDYQQMSFWLLADQFFQV